MVADAAVQRERALLIADTHGENVLLGDNSFQAYILWPVGNTKQEEMWQKLEPVYHLVLWVYWCITLQDPNADIVLECNIPVMMLVCFWNAVLSKHGATYCNLKKNNQLPQQK